MTKRQHNRRTQYEIGPLKMALDSHLRKYSSTVRIVNLWNGLAEYVISADTVNIFENR